jgi:hypothetical protein
MSHVPARKISVLKSKERKSLLHLGPIVKAPKNIVNISSIAGKSSQRVARLINLSNQELQIKNYRENLGLDPTPPAWLLGGEPRGRNQQKKSN